VGNSRPGSTTICTTGASRTPPTSTSGHFLGDGETDEPESRGLAHVAALEGLDNLTFVINCNLQRLDGPVRGNGKIIQELESFFRGAGWNVIKVAGAASGRAAARGPRRCAGELMNTTPDGDFQTYKANDGVTSATTSSVATRAPRLSSSR